MHQIQCKLCKFVLTLDMNDSICSCEKLEVKSGKIYCDNPDWVIILDDAGNPIISKYVDGKIEEYKLMSAIDRLDQEISFLEEQSEMSLHIPINSFDLVRFLSLIRDCLKQK